MEIIDFSKSNSILNQYMSELRDKNYQRNRLLFRHNIKRIGEMMAYELSKTLEYKPKTVTTPLEGRQRFCLGFPHVYQSRAY